MQEVLGHPPVIRIYGQNSSYGNTKDIVPDFCYVLGIPLQELGAYKRERLNPSFDVHLIEIKRIFNSVYHGTHKEWWNDFFQQYSLNKDGMRNYSILGTEERKKFLAVFETENEEIAHSFFKRTDGILFPETEDDDFSIYHQASPFEAEMIRLFSALMIWQKDCMEMKLRFYRKIYIKRNKKLAYFGAGHICRRCLLEYNNPVSLIIDNYTDDNSIENIPVISPKQLKNWHEYIIVVTCEAYAEISKQLENLGLIHGMDYLHWKEVFL